MKALFIMVADVKNMTLLEGSRKAIYRLFKLRDELLNTTYDCSWEEKENQLGYQKFLTCGIFSHSESFLDRTRILTVFSIPLTKTIREGVENIIVETCFPIKLTHGHILNILNKGFKQVFIPSIINLKKTSANITNTFACPFSTVNCLHIKSIY